MNHSGSRFLSHQALTLIFVAGVCFPAMAQAASSIETDETLIDKSAEKPLTSLTWEDMRRLPAKDYQEYVRKSLLTPLLPSCDYNNVGIALFGVFPAVIGIAAAPFTAGISLAALGFAAPFFVTSGVREARDRAILRQQAFRNRPDSGLERVVAEVRKKARLPKIDDTHLSEHIALRAREIYDARLMLVNPPNWQIIDWRSYLTMLSARAPDEIDQIRNAGTIYLRKDSCNLIPNPACGFRSLTNLNSLKKQLLPEEWMQLSFKPAPGALRHQFKTLG
jgi:hypothetical protein